ncbi:MAG: succinate dehydrogenase, hydrophobic membrane anchor protein [Sphingomonadales bacterium]
MSLKTPLGHVRGLGSAKSGTHHWWLQRVTAIGMLLLMIWFVVSLIGLRGASFEEATAWISQPLVSVIMLVLIGTAFYHMRLGIQVVIEDYLHGALRIAGIVALNFGTALLSAACLFSVLKIAFGA